MHRCRQILIWIWMWNITQQWKSKARIWSWQVCYGIKRTIPQSSTHMYAWAATTQWLQLGNAVCIFKTVRVLQDIFRRLFQVVCIIGMNSMTTHDKVKFTKKLTAFQHVRQKNPEDHHYHSTFSQLDFKDIQINALIMITCMKQNSQIVMKKMSLMSPFIALHSFSSLIHETMKGGNCGHTLHTSRKAGTSQQWLHYGSPPMGNGTMNMSTAIELVTSAGSKLLNTMTSILTAHELQNLTCTCNW